MQETALLIRPDGSTESVAARGRKFTLTELQPLVDVRRGEPREQEKEN